MDITTELMNALKPEEQAQKSATRSAVVARVDETGTPWVYVAGSEKETPTSSTAAQVKRGDKVTVEWRNNRLYIVGNYTDPSAGVETVKEVEKTATGAEAAASEAWESANRAFQSATEAAESAASAKTSADNASEYAARALGNLATVQSVSETLAWITQHGTMALTQDTEPDPTHVYFVVDANGDYTVNGTTYSIVTEPVAANMGSYYELTIDESLNNYVGTHLALTAEGLWLLPASSGGYKVLIATGNGTTYTAAGTYIIDSNGDTAAWFGASVLLGKNGGARARLDADAFLLTDENGDPMFRTDVLDVYGYVPKSVSYSETISSNIVSVAITEPIETGTTITAVCTHGTTLYERWSGSVEFTKGTAATKTATLKCFDPSLSVADATMSVTYDGANTITYDRGGAGDSYGITDITTPSQVLSPTLSYGGAKTIGGFGVGFGRGIFSTEQDQTVIGRYNRRGIIYDSGNRYYAGLYPFVIGNGTNDGNRSNALTVDWDGQLECKNVGAATAITDYTVSKTSGNSTCTVRNAMKSGNMIMLGLSFKCTSAYTAQNLSDHANLFVGTVPEKYKPACTTSGVGYIDSQAVVAQISGTSTRQIIVRPTAQLNNGKEPYIYFTYFI